MEDVLRIGEVATACGVSADTIRYYERKGAIPPATRSANGYREYSCAVLHEVQRVRRTLAIGFSLDEVARMFRQRAAGRPPCREVRALAAQKLAELDQRIAAMSTARGELASIIDDWDARLSRTPEGQPALLLETLVLAES